jgi:nucleoside-diphosphate-sugar epimerase
MTLPPPPSPTGTSPSTSALQPDLAGRRVLVTGATGFIGGHVVEMLDRAGAEIHATARNDNPSTSLATPVTWHRVDLTDGAATDDLLGEIAPEHLIHLASLVKGARDPDLLLPMFAANCATTVNLLEAARRQRVRRVQLAGSLEEPDRPGQLATSPYALSKAAAHMYGDYYQAATDVEVINLQIFMVYGPAQIDERKLVPYVIRCLQAGRVPELSSGGREVDWVYVGDVAEGIVRCCLIDRVPTQPVPLGTGMLTTIRQVVEALVAISENDVEPQFGSMADRSNEVVRSADVALVRDQLGWAPSTTVADGLKMTYDWYLEH